MKPAILCAAGLAILSFCMQPAAADTEFRARLMTRVDVPGRGQCDIRVQIDGEADVSVQGDLVHLRTLPGRGGRDDGSECNAPLPARKVPGFHFEVHDGRGEVRLVAEPSSRNDFQAVVHIRSDTGGEGRYGFRLTWALTGQESDARPVDRDFDKPDARGGLTWNNATHLGGRGRGSSVLSGQAPARLSVVDVDVDRGGRILVSFRIDHGRSLTLSGTVIGSEGATLKADVAFENGRLRLRGPLYLSRDGRGDLSKITLEATDGQNHLSVSWDQR